MEILTGPIHCETSARSASPLGGMASSEVSCAKAREKVRTITRSTAIFIGAPARVGYVSSVRLRQSRTVSFGFTQFLGETLHFITAVERVVAGDDFLESGGCRKSAIV